MPERLPYPVVGVPGFEPGASSSRTMRATKLRHTPMASRAEEEHIPRPVESHIASERGVRVRRVTSGGHANR